MALPTLPSSLPDLPEIEDDFHQEVFTHSSSTSSNSNIPYNRLACLGDTYLTAAITKILYDHPAIFDAGEITEIRKSYISNENVAQWGRAYGFDNKVIVATHMLPLRNENRNKISASIFRAYIAALALGTSHEIMTEFIKLLVDPGLDTVRSNTGAKESIVDKMSMQKLHERLVRLQIDLPQYEVEDLGAQSQPRFEVRCTIKGNEVGRAAGRSIADAKRAAAEKALRKGEKFLTLLKDVKREN